MDLFIDFIFYNYLVIILLIIHLQFNIFYLSIIIAYEYGWTVDTIGLQYFPSTFK